MLVFALNLSATGFGQISMDAKGKTFKEVFAALESETNYRFFYNDDLKAIDNLTDLEFKDQNINQILDEMLESSEFDYRILENNLVVIRLKDEL